MFTKSCKNVLVLTKKLPSDFWNVFSSIRKLSTQSTKAAAEIKYGKENRIFYVLFDRAHKKNAMTVEMYEGLYEATKAASDDKDTILTVFKGLDGSFSSGNDFGAGNFEKFQNPTNWKPFIDELIKHEKPVVALVDGAAIGIGCTMLGLCDHVIASDLSFFLTPFSMFGLCAEGMSSATFPRIMGPTKAARLLLFNEKISAQEAYDAGLVSKLVKSEEFEEVTQRLLKSYVTYQSKSMMITKRLIRPPELVKQWHEVNAREAKFIEEQMKSEDTIRRLSERFLKK